MSHAPPRRWNDYVKRVLDRVGGFPKNQRFVLGTRLADVVLEVMEVLAEATHARGPAKAQLLVKANWRIESVRWLVNSCRPELRRPLGGRGRAGFRNNGGVQGVRHERAAKETASRRGE